MRWTEQAAYMRKTRVLVRKPGGLKPLERPRRRWNNNIKMDLKEATWGNGLDLRDSGSVKMASTCECGNEPQVSIQCGQFLDYLRTFWLLKNGSAPWS